jgi:hypothetical protein
MARNCAPNASPGARSGRDVGKHAMSPKELRQTNIARFERLLLDEAGSEKRALIHRLLAEERSKPDSAYPDKRPAANANSPSE